MQYWKAALTVLILNKVKNNHAQVEVLPILQRRHAESLYRLNQLARLIAHIQRQQQRVRKLAANLIKNSFSVYRTLTVQ